MSTDYPLIPSRPVPTLEVRAKFRGAESKPHESESTTSFSLAEMLARFGSEHCEFSDMENGLRYPSIIIP